MKFPHPRNQKVLELFANHRYVTLSGAGNFSSKTFVVSDILDQFPDLNKVLWVVNDYGQQESIVQAFQDWTPFKVETLEKNSAYSKVIRALSSLRDNERVALVITYEQLLNLYPSKKELERLILSLCAKDEINAVELFENLIQLGYCVSEDPYLQPGSYLRHGE